MKNLFRNAAMLLLMASVGTIFSCKDEDKDPTVVASFTFEVDATDPLKVNFTNTSTDSDGVSWNFGDGSTLSTDENPTHTFAAGGDFTVTLTASDKNGKDEAVASKTVTVVGGVTPGPFSADRLVGGAIYVGPIGAPAPWYIVPVVHLNGTDPDVTNDWSCMMDDEFIFTAGASSAEGSMEYKTNGTARNDGYMGAPNGCWDDAQITASGNGAAFGSGIHSYKVIDESVSPSSNFQIELTNGPTGAAFIGFYKGYYGGENTNSSNPPNGGFTTNLYEVIDYQVADGKETLTLAVDLSVPHDNSFASWFVVLVR
jgi:PKD repeat protein